MCSFCISVCEDDCGKKTKNEITYQMVTKWHTYSISLADCSCSFSSPLDCCPRASNLPSHSNCSLVESRSRGLAPNSTFWTGQSSTSASPQPSYPSTASLLVIETMQPRERKVQRAFVRRSDLLVMHPTGTEQSKRTYVL